MTNGNKAVEKVKREVAKQPKPMSVTDLIRQSTRELGRALPAHMNPERLVRIAETTMRFNPDLYKCTSGSFVGALFQAAQTGLEPGIDGQAFILPYNNRKKIIENGKTVWKTVKEAQFSIGYKGWVQLFYRHEKALALDVHTVREGDEFDYAYGTNSYLQHIPTMVGRGKPTYFWVMAELTTGGKVFKVMSYEECIEHGKKHSKCFDKKNGVFYPNTPWVTEEANQCKKTAIIQLCKILPKSIEIQRAMDMDNTTKDVVQGKVRADMTEVPDHTDWNEDGSQDVKAEVVNEKETVNKDTETEKALDELEQLRQELKDDIIFRNVLGKSFGVENTDELTDKQIPAFKKEIRAIIDDLENIKS